MKEPIAMTEKLSRQQRRALERAQKKQNRASNNQIHHGVRSDSITFNTETTNISGWIPKEESVVIAGRRIPGMVYVGKPPAYYQTDIAHNLDSIYINPEFEVAIKVDNDSKYELESEAKAYDLLTPIDRANYLNWLANGKNDVSYSHEYMLLYFMGLEWAVTDMSLEIKERNDAYHEILRLFDLYHDSKFIDILFNLIVYIMRQNYSPQVFEGEGAFSKMDRRTLYYHHGGIKTLNNEPLKAPHVETILIRDNIEEIEKLRENCPYVFEKLFEAKFDEVYPQGLIIEKPTQILENKYESILHDLEIDNTVGYNDEEVPDIEFSSVVHRVAKNIGTSVAEELAQYSSEIERNVQKIKNQGQLEFLPRPESGDNENKCDQIILAWVEEALLKSDEITVEELARLMDFCSIAENDATQWYRIIVALERVGYGIVPEFGVFLYKKNAKTPMYLFKLNSKPEDRQNSSGIYYTALISAAIGGVILDIDNDITDDQLKLISKRSEELNGLTAYENELLKANLDSFLVKDINPYEVIQCLPTGLSFDHDFVRESVKLYGRTCESMNPAAPILTTTAYRLIGLDPNDITSDLIVTGETKRFVSNVLKSLEQSGSELDWLRLKPTI